MADSMNASIVHHIAQLANIPVTADEEKTLADGFVTTLQVVDELKKINTKNVSPTHQLSGLTNVLREDVVDTERMFTQEQALANAPQSHNGFFVVEQILDQE
jgi:aspartyl-tRNA(Asn)/glutamyl-tRNA(Gln) amidotransferase subunit C